MRDLVLQREIPNRILLRAGRKRRGRGLGRQKGEPRGGGGRLRRWALMAHSKTGRVRTQHAVGFVTFWGEGGQKQKHFREAQSFSLPWVGVKNIVISLFAQHVPSLQGGSRVQVCSPIQHGLSGTDVLPGRGEARGPQCPDLTQVLGKIPRVFLPWEDKGIESSISRSLKRLLSPSAWSDSACPCEL